MSLCVFVVVSFPQHNGTDDNDNRFKELSNILSRSTCIFAKSYYNALEVTFIIPMDKTFAASVWRKGTIFETDEHPISDENKCQVDLLASVTVIIDKFLGYIF